MLERFLTRKEVETLVGYSKTSIYRLIGEGEFPRPIKYNARTSRWRESEIAAWQQAKLETPAPG